MFGPGSFHLGPLLCLTRLQENSLSVLVGAAVSFRASSLALLDPTLPGEVVSVPTFQAARPPVLDTLGVGELLGVGGVPGAGIHRPHHAGAALSCVEVVEAASSPASHCHWLSVLVSDGNVPHISLRAAFAHTGKKTQVP